MRASLHSLAGVSTRWQSGPFAGGLVHSVDGSPPIGAACCPFGAVSPRLALHFLPKRPLSLHFSVTILAFLPCCVTLLAFPRQRVLSFRKVRLGFCLTHSRLCRAFLTHPCPFFRPIRWHVAVFAPIRFCYTGTDQACCAILETRTALDHAERVPWRPAPRREDVAARRWAGA
jgi:hypothetical protein